MISTRRGFLRGLIAMAAVAALPLAARQAPSVNAAPTMPAPVAQASGVRVLPASDWVPLGPDVQTGQLFTPASGALYVTWSGGLLRSDDAGASWRSVTLPRGSFGGGIEVDPLDHRIVYADAQDGLHRSDDEGRTWTPILPSNRRTSRIAISPANTSVLYVAQSGGQGGGDFWFQRSVDRGATWQQLEEQHQSPCGWSTLILAPHPTGQARVFRTAGCYAGRNLGDDLKESRDNGSTWRTLFTPKTAFPHTLIVGTDSEPNRLVLSVNNDYRGGGSLLYTSSDDGGTWLPILENTGGGTMTGSKAPNVTIGGLTYNPQVPSTIYVGLNGKADPFKPVDFATVSTTSDGGMTWTQAGTQQLPQIHSLALGIDGLNLFAATRNGVWRLSLG